MTSSAVLGDWTRAFTPLEKARLMGEILWTYFTVRRVMDEGQIVEAVERLRPASGGPPALPISRDAMLNGLRLGNAVRRTLTVLPTDSRCLMRSLVLSAMLARRGIESLLVIGVRTEPSFGAHAWVEYQGRALLPPGDDRMQRLVEV